MALSLAAKPNIDAGTNHIDWPTYAGSRKRRTNGLHQCTDVN